MSNQRPHFEKKELALSCSPYVYIPVDIPVYTVEVSHREEIDGDLLQRALDRTIRRMPYLSDTLEIDHGAVYYAKNALPMLAAHHRGPRAVGGSETNYHMLDLTWDGNQTWFSMYHGFCDGQGINAFLESVLYHYYCLKDGVEYDPLGIRTDKTRMTEAETFEPLSKAYEISPDFKMPEKKEQAAPYHLPEIVSNPAGRKTRTLPFLVEVSWGPPAYCGRRCSCLLMVSEPFAKFTQSQVRPSASDSRSPVKRITRSSMP